MEEFTPGPVSDPPNEPEPTRAPAATTSAATPEGLNREALETPTAGEPEGLRSRVIAVLQTIFDPEIPVNIYELGLIYGIEMDLAGAARVKMTLTAPNCPAAQSLPGEVETKVRSVEGVTDSKVEIVWEPQWGMQMMSEAARLQLGF